MAVAMNMPPAGTFHNQTSSGPGAAALSGKYVQTDGRYPHRGRSKLTGRWHYLAKDKGELQITDYGLSGIPVFQVSRYAARALDEKKKVRVYVDFMPGWDNSESFRLLKKRALLLAYKPQRNCLPEC